MTARRGLFAETDDGRLAQRRASAEADLDITPMIDVTFLLLIFFMVSSTMQGKPDLDVPVARYGLGVEDRGATIITIRAPRGAGEEPVIVLGDPGAVEGTLDDIGRYVEEGITANRSRVVVKAEGDVPEGFVQDVARAVKAINGCQLYMGVRDEPVQ